MSRRRRPIVLLSLACAVALAAGQPASSRYVNDFETAQVGAVPDDITVLDGPFSVNQVDGNKCLELAGDPIGSFGALFGPDQLTAVEVKARIWAAPTGKRFPEFGIGANDAGGYKLLLAPGRGAVELRRGDQTRASAVPFKWTASTWTWFRLRVEPKDKSTWSIRGKVWSEGNDEPKDWTIATDDLQAPSPGRASLWGMDFSEQPIRFDDLSVAALPDAPPRG